MCALRSGRHDQPAEYAFRVFKMQYDRLLPTFGNHALHPVQSMPHYQASSHLHLVSAYLKVQPLRQAQKIHSHLTVTLRLADSRRSESNGMHGEGF